MLLTFLEFLFVNISAKEGFDLATFYRYTRNLLFSLVAPRLPCGTPRLKTKIITRLMGYTFILILMIMYYLENNVHFEINIYDSKVTFRIIITEHEIIEA